MFPRRCRPCRGPYSPFLCLGVLALCLWLLLLLFNSVSLSRTERSFEGRHTPLLDARRRRHARTLRLEIKGLVGRPALNWTDFLRGPLADNFRGAPCSCGRCNEKSATMPTCHGVRLLGDLTAQVRFTECYEHTTTYREIVWAVLS